MIQVTRVEIADCIEQAFGEGEVAAATIVHTAVDAGARSEVLEVLGRLEERSYRTLRELWRELSDIPVES